jgi:ABC-type Fe3+-siderophore transport system permease subunit
LGARILGHTVAILVGFVLMVIGLALGVTMVLLPIGLVVGLIGVLVFVWGLFEWKQKR